MFGVDDPSGVVTILLTNFAPGTTVSFNGIDPDCLDDPYAGITVDGIAGSVGISLTLLPFGLGFDFFEFTGSGTVAVIN